MTLHHIGYVVDKIEDAMPNFEILGYKMSSLPVNDDIQRCRICFIERANEPLIELVEPYENNKSLRKMQAQRGNAPYHMCYEVEDVEALFDELSEKEGWMPLFRPVEAAAFNNRLITYFYNTQMGYVEFVNCK